VEEGLFDEVGFVDDDEISLVGESVDEVGFVEEVGEVGTDEIGSEGEGLGGLVGAGGDGVAPAAVELFFGLFEAVIRWTLAMGWWARGAGELAFEVGEFLFYAVGAGEVAVERIESEIVGASSENCCIRKVKSELALEGES